jgi:hypothetical protein
MASLRDASWSVHTRSSAAADERTRGYVAAVAAGPRRTVCRTQLSCMFVFLPIEIGSFWSPRITAPNQMLAPSPTSTFPMIVAVCTNPKLTAPRRDEQNAKSARRAGHRVRLADVPARSRRKRRCVVPLRRGRRPACWYRSILFCQGTAYVLDVLN